MGVRNSTHVLHFLQKSYSQYKIRIHFIDTHKIDNINFINEIMNLVFVFSNLQVKGKGTYYFSISSDVYRNKVRYRYDPFCVKSSIKLVAEVTEQGRGIKQSASIKVPLVANPISVSFSINNPTIFKPGLPYTIKVSHVPS